MKKEAEKIIEDWSKETGLKVKMTDDGLEVLYTKVGKKRCLCHGA